MDWRLCILEDGDLLIRPWAEGDWDEVGTSPRDPEVGRYFGTPLGEHPRSADPDAPDFAIVDRARVVGKLWCRPGSRPLEIGYFLRRDARGRGLATRSLRLASDWLLVRGVGRIDLCTHPDNAASQAVALRAGYEPSGEIEEYARFKDGTTRALRYSRFMQRPPYARAANQLLFRPAL